MTDDGVSFAPVCLVFVVQRQEPGGAWASVRQFPGAERAAAFDLADKLQAKDGTTETRVMRRVLVAARRRAP